MDELEHVVGAKVQVLDLVSVERYPHYRSHQTSLGRNVVDNKSYSISSIIHTRMVSRTSASGDNAPVLGFLALMIAWTKSSFSLGPTFGILYAAKYSLRRFRGKFRND